MAVELTFESHNTTLDNEAKPQLASGWYDVQLSPLGVEQAGQLGQRRRDKGYAAVFCSDLQRSYKSAEIAFAGIDVPIIRDKRLRECDYGDYTRFPMKEVDEQKALRVDTPFPGGESYAGAARRVGEVLHDLRRDYDGKKVLIIGHRATQYGIEHFVSGALLKDLVARPFKWQPGWEYTL
ncbi:MAG: histidine phosphatase family protein [Alphaproteobacteria bacterium]|nr:histidine phosphatase family protein [Alphaproteobacteria bacterium]